MNDCAISNNGFKSLHELYSIAVVPKLVRAVTQIKVSIMSYCPQEIFFAFQVENFFCSDRT